MIFRAWYRYPETLRGRDHCGFKISARADGFALIARPGAHATLPRTRLEIGIAFRSGRSDDPTLDTDLPIQVVPMHDDGDARVCVDLDRKSVV